MINKNEIIQILRQYKKDFADKYGITRMGIFGSVARNDADDESDVDVFVAMVKPDLFTIAGIRNDLETKLNNSVDLIHYGKYMNISLKQIIDRDAFDV
jgi:uncharacterized protein